MSISKEAIEAAARALHEFNPTFAQDKWDATELDYRSWRREQAIAALTAAAPFIQAAALAPILALHKPVEIQVITGDCAEEECDHEDIEDCPTVPYEVCRACVEVAETANMYALEGGAFHYAWPCPTARAATIEGKSE